MKGLIIAEHPLIQNKILLLRNKDTNNKEFRELTDEISTMLFYEAMRDAHVIETEVSTPLMTTKGRAIAKKIALIPILRAGAGMCQGALDLMPTAAIGHIGIYRDPVSLLPVEYYCKLPSDISDRKVFVLDPMLATGGTSSAAISFLKDRGVTDMTLICIIAAPEGVKKVTTDHEDIKIIIAALDEGLNEHGYIFPGLGDAGDRLYGTK